MNVRAWLACLLLFMVGQAAGAVDAEALYREHCVVCHGIDRLGGMGPALLPENLGRLRQGEARQVIAQGRPATQMMGFAAVLSEAELQALTTFIYTSPLQAPVWSMAQIQASHKIHSRVEALSSKPRFDADPLNLFLVVELGDHHATVLDGDTFTPIHRFQTHFALHGGPKYSPDGRFVYLASRDGWVSKYDLYSLSYVAEVRAGINTRNIAVSHDGRYVLAGNYLPHTLVMLDAHDLTPIEVIPIADASANSSRASAVYTAPPRGSFIVALKDIPEVWEIPYGGSATEPRIPGNSFRFPIRRIPVGDVLDDFFFDDDYQHLVGATRTGGGQVVDLGAGQLAAKIDLPGMPHLGSGISFVHQGRRVLATPNLKEGLVTVIDAEDWRVVKRIATHGPGFFMRSHDNTPYLWTDVFLSAHKDEMHIIDKDSLEIVKTLRPAPGKTAAHVEFTRDGSHALVSIWDMDGAVVVYDARTLAEIKRIPMRKPSGKYNVFNKINYASGTSH